MTLITRMINSKNFKNLFNSISKLNLKISLKRRDLILAHNHRKNRMISSKKSKVNANNKNNKING